MENGIKERLYELRKTLKLTQGKFAKKIGLNSDVAVSLMESGKSRITDQNINLICLTFGTNEEWLRNGTGNMFGEKAPGEYEILEIFYRLSAGMRAFFLKMGRELLATDIANHGEEPPPAPETREPPPTGTEGGGDTGGAKMVG
jgi:transcriptional regulator with XRE-family HTH domain